MSELFFTPGAVGGVSTATPRVDHPAARALEAARAKAAMDASTLLTSYHDKIAEIRDDDALEDGPNNDYLSTEAKAQIIQDRKRAAAEELYESTVSEHQKIFDTLAGEGEKHTTELRQALFGLGNDGSAVLAQAISADQAKLLEMIKLGELTGADSISRAAFAAAGTRGDAPEVLHVSRLIQPAGEDQWTCVGPVDCLRLRTVRAKESSATNKPGIPAGVSSRSYPAG